MKSRILKFISFNHIMNFTFQFQFQFPVVTGKIFRSVTVSLYQSHFGLFQLLNFTTCALAQQVDLYINLLRFNYFSSVNEFKTEIRRNYETLRPCTLSKISKNSKQQLMFTSPGFNKQNSCKGFEGPFRSAPAYYWWYLEKLMLCVETVFFM